VEQLRPQTTLFCALLALAIALSIILRGRRPTHLLFAGFSATIAFWYGSQSLYGIFNAPIWVRATGILTVLLPQFALHLFLAVAPTEKHEDDVRLTRPATLVGLVMLGLVLSPYAEAPIALGVTYSYVFGLLAAALLVLARRGLSNPSRAVRDRTRFLVAVGVLAFTFTMADFLSFLGVILPPIGAVLSIVFLYVLAETIARPRLADLYTIAVRLVVATVLAFCLAGVFYVFVSLLGRFNTMYLNAVLAAIVFLVLFEPLQIEVEKRMYQAFFRERRALERTVTDLRRRLAHALELDELVSILIPGFEESRRVTACALYVRDADGDGFDRVGQIGQDSPARLESLAIRPVLDRMEKEPSLPLEELARSEAADTALMACLPSLGALHGAVLFPLRSGDEGILGILAVADERMRDAFTEEEVVLLEGVAAQCAVVLANSRLYSRMKERDRLAALGAMAAGLAHEVKNPLGAIKGAAQLLEEEDTNDAGSREFVGIILEEVERLDRVVGNFLDYARPHAGNPIPLDVNAAVRRTVQIFTSQPLDGVDVRLVFGDDVPRVSIDPEKFRQVLINLLTNAVHAMNGEGTITVTTGLKRSGRGLGTLHGLGGGAPSSERRSGATSTRISRADDLEVAEVSVTDTGPGITQKVLKNLFIPFFTTKEQGTGLGLAISQSIVQRAGGIIHVQTQPGSGTTFTVALPATADRLSTAPRSEAAALRSEAAAPRSEAAALRSEAAAPAFEAGSSTGSGPAPGESAAQPSFVRAR
jgi:signal transduction histidine kinase